MLHNVHWHGGDGYLPRDWITDEREKNAAGGYMSNEMWTLKQHIKELVLWRPETTVDELELACGRELSAKFIASIKSELSFLHRVCWSGAKGPAIGPPTEITDVAGTGHDCAESPAICTVCDPYASIET
jgi:hypothetical protein